MLNASLPHEFLFTPFIIVFILFCLPHRLVAELGCNGGVRGEYGWDRVDLTSPH
jgi:hypothetical protein